MTNVVEYRQNKTFFALEILFILMYYNITGGEDVINKISERIADEMKSLDLIDESESEAYAYGTELFLLKTVFYVMIILLAVLTNSLITGLVFTVSYLALRQYSGGYHCRSPKMCMIVSAGMYIAMIFFYRFASVIFPLISTAALFPVWLYAPCESENNPLSGDERNACRRKALSIALIISMSAWAAYLCGIPRLYYPLSWSLAAAAVLMIISPKKSNERNGQK